MIGVGTMGPVGSPAAREDFRSSAGDAYAPERDAWAVLASVGGLGPVAFAALLVRFGSGEGVLTAATEPGAVVRLADTPPVERDPGAPMRRPVPAAVARAIAEAAADRGRFLERLRGLAIRVVTAEEPAYPTRLLAIEMPPHVLFARGSVAALQHDRAAAIVGTRHPTSAGRVCAGRVAAALVAADAAVISGLAYGIDGAAHESTIHARGATVAVIGGGHATAVPVGHDLLAQRIVDAGGAVVSESAPDVAPTRGTFPRRNRIISGLADATIVVEAPARSGALITASWALEQGRECFLVPGPIDVPAVAGCLSFLREFHGAARIVAGIPELVADLGWVSASPSATPDRLAGAAIQGLGDAAGRLALLLIGGVTTVDELVATADLAPATVVAALAQLEHRGLAVAHQGRFRPAGALLGERVRPMLR